MFQHDLHLITNVFLKIEMKSIWLLYIMHAYRYGNMKYILHITRINAKVSREKLDKRSKSECPLCLWSCSILYQRNAFQIIWEIFVTLQLSVIFNILRIPLGSMFAFFYFSSQKKMLRKCEVCVSLKLV